MDDLTTSQIADNAEAEEVNDKEVDSNNDVTNDLHDSESSSISIDFRKPLAKSSLFSRSAATVIGLETVIDSEDEDDVDDSVDIHNSNCTTAIDCAHPASQEVDIESGHPCRLRFVTSSSAADLSTLRAAKSASSSSSCSAPGNESQHRIEVRRSKSKVRTYLKRCKDALTGGGGGGTQSSNANEDNTCPTTQRRRSAFVVATSSSSWYLDETEDRRKASDPVVATESDSMQPPAGAIDVVDITTIEIRAKPVELAIRSVSSDDIATSDPVASGLSDGGCESDDRLSQLSSDTVIYQPTESSDPIGELIGVEDDKKVSSFRFEEGYLF